MRVAEEDYIKLIKVGLFDNYDDVKEYLQKIANRFDVGIGISTEEKLLLNKTVKQYTNISANILKLAFLFSVVKNIIYSPSPGFINRGA